MTNRDHDDGDRLGELLRQVVPGGPSPAGRAGDVVRRAHRATRRRGFASVAAVAVVAFAIVAGPSLVDSPGDKPSATPRDDTTAQAAELRHPYMCTDRADESASSADAETISDNAVLARVCAGSVAGRGAWTPPVDALTTHIAAVVAAYRRLPVAQPSDFICAVPESAPFTLTLQFVDEHVVTLVEAPGGCNVLGVEGAPGLGRVGADMVLQEYVAQLRRQRAVRKPSPNEQVPLTCLSAPSAFAPGLMQSGAELRLTRAVLCTYPGPRRLGHHPQHHPMTADEVATVDADFAADASTVPRYPTCPPGTGSIALLGETAWGDREIVIRNCGTWSSGDLYWTPGTAAQRVIDAALRR